MKTIKKIGLVSAVAFAMLAFSACDDSSSASSDETSVSSSSVETSDLDESSSSVDKKSSGNESTEKDKSSSSVKGSEPVEVSSSSAKETKNSSDSKSSSSVKSGESSSSSKDKSSSSVSSSSSEITDYVGLPCEGILSDGNTGKIYLCVDGRYVLYVPTESSSSGPYEPFDQTLPLRGQLSDKYKTFTDTRNERVYYYLTIVGRDTNNVKDSIQVMAQNLNIADVTLKVGENMTNDDKIERYCYDDDTTNCDRYGGLYQWAEALQLPSRCNTESCASLIQPNHQGICPDGWRMMNANDFRIALTSTDDFANGLRSGYYFSGSNKSGLSLTGSGRYFHQKGYEDLDEAFYMYYPVEYVFGDVIRGSMQYVTRYENNVGPGGLEKYCALSVRCVKLK